MARGFSGRGVRQRKQWTSIGSAEFHMTGNGTFGSGIATVSPLQPQTVLRMLGEYVIVPTSAPTDADAVLVGVGICVVSTDAAVLGPTALPEPIGDPDYPWLYWSSHPFHFANVTTDPSQQGGSLRHTFDIRSMRKMKTSESLTAVIQYSDIAGAPPMTIVLG